MAALGRPRDPAVDGAALEAAVRLIVEGGYANLTMERIADRAAVSKAALYRRWPNKVELVVDAVAAAAGASLVVPDTGCLRNDVAVLAEPFTRGGHPDQATFDALSAAVASDPELAERCGRIVGAGLAEVFEEMIARAVRRGELPSGTDVEILAGAVAALLRYRRQTTGQAPDATFVGRIVEQFF